MIVRKYMFLMNVLAPKRVSMSMYETDVCEWIFTVSLKLIIARAIVYLKPAKSISSN